MLLSRCNRAFLKRKYTMGGTFPWSDADLRRPGRDLVGKLRTERTYCSYATTVSHGRAVLGVRVRHADPIRQAFL